MSLLGDNTAFFSHKTRLKSFLYKVLIVIAVISIFLIAFKQVIPLIMTLLLVFLASISKLYKHFTGFSFGFELVTFASILFFFSHGIFLGLLLCMLMLLVSTVISGRFSQVLVFQACVYVVIAIISLFLSGMDIVKAGKILVIIYNLLLHSITLFFLRMPIHSSLLNFAVNIFANFLMLDYFGEVLFNYLNY